MTAKHAAAMLVPQEVRKDCQTTEKQGNEAKGKGSRHNFMFSHFVMSVCVCINEACSTSTKRGERDARRIF